MKLLIHSQTSATAQWSWIWGMDKQFYLKLCNWRNYLSILGLKLYHISKIIYTLISTVHSWLTQLSYDKWRRMRRRYLNSCKNILIIRMSLWFVPSSQLRVTWHFLVMIWQGTATTCAIDYVTWAQCVKDVVTLGLLYLDVLDMDLRKTNYSASISGGYFQSNWLYAETKMSFWRYFRHWLRQKLSKCHFYYSRFIPNRSYW